MARLHLWGDMHEGQVATTSNTSQGDADCMPDEDMATVQKSQKSLNSLQWHLVNVTLRLFNPKP